VNIVVAIYSEFRSWCIPEAEVERLRAEFPEHTFVRADDDAETLAAIASADVAFSSRITPAHLAAAPKLRWVHSPAAGVGAMLFPQMIESPVVMTNSRGNSSRTIAEHVIAVTLALLRSLPLAWRRQAERVWAQNEFNESGLVRTVLGANVLVVGLGSIGGEAARLFSALGATVTGIRRRPDGEVQGSDLDFLCAERIENRDLTPAPGLPGRPQRRLVRVVAPAALMGELPGADVVVLSAPQTAETWHLIDDRALAAMKEDAVLVNVSRGKLVDEAALLRALDSGRLRGAALDVFEHEPLDPASPLWRRPDVLITPHVSGFHPDHWPEATKLFAQNLRRFAAGTPLINQVDKQAGY
jgi:phosphoglycerate dehydrogenase-like enzyme